MIRGTELEERAYEPGHIQQVLTEITQSFPGYFENFAQQPLESVFDKSIQAHQKEQTTYREYLHLEALEEFEWDPNAFKSHTRKRCPIIQRCLWSQDEVMRDYKRSFEMATGRELLDTVRNIAEFGISYAASFDSEAHRKATTYSELDLETLNEEEYHCGGVIGYGIQSSLLHGVYPHSFAHRSQNAVWSLYFLSGRKDFGLAGGSEFLMVHTDQGTCEQNYFYPAELFGFYALKVFLMLKSACADLDISFDGDYRYVYLSAFCDHIADMHREHINTYRWSSEYVERQPWF